jgi:hypothetical protein
MPMESYSLESGSPRRLEVAWRGMFNEFTVKLDGQPIGDEATRKELRAGKEYELPDGSKLVAHLGRNIMPELHLLRNGKPLPESAYISRVRIAGATSFLVGGLGLIVGGIPVLLEPEGFASGELSLLSFPLIALIYGVVFAMLSFFILRRSVLALILAVALWVPLMIGTLGYIFSSGDLNPGALVVGGLGVGLIQAIEPALSLKRGRPVHLIRLQ